MNITNPTANTLNPITVGDRLVLTKGCKARGLDKGITVRVESVTPMGADYSHAARVVLKPLNGFGWQELRALCPSPEPLGGRFDPPQRRKLLPHHRGTPCRAPIAARTG